MPQVKKLRWRRNGFLWSGDCPRSDCRHGFRVDAEPWMQKIHVLMEVRDLERDRHRHLHGEHVVTGYNERGGE